MGDWVKPRFHVAMEKKTIESKTIVIKSFLLIFNPMFMLAHLSLGFGLTWQVQF